MTCGSMHEKATELQGEARTNTPRFVVGIGASAGGLESLEKLFRNLSPSTGMAFVVIQHLSPDFKSMMYELLARDTSMSIKRVEDGMLVEGDTIYLLPPKKEMTISRGRLYLADKDPTRSLTLPIDHFLESLASECQDKAVAIILSGSGSDGTRGVLEIANHGGFVIAESPESAKFDSMPLSALATGVVDAVLSPEKIGESLVRYAANPYKEKSDRAYQDGLRRDGLRGLDAIYELFRQAYDLDFSLYKDATILRRIHRRLSMTGSGTIDSYADLLQRDAGELSSLYEDLLIGVTQFFRDPEIFAVLSQSVFPEMVSRHDGNQPIRAWCAACATGEEAYSIAIAFAEAIQKSGKSVDVKIFATDVHRTSLERAGRGQYSADSLKGLSPDLKHKYFVLRDGVYQIIPEIRKMIVFAPHNLLRDAPFTDLDFVSCRNLLIYFQPNAQSRILSLFQYGLNIGGYMLLGSSETPGELASEFDTFNERAKIYRKSRTTRLANEFRTPITMKMASNGTRADRSVDLPRATITHGDEVARRHEVYDSLLNCFMPPSVLIDSDRRVLDTFAAAEKLLKLPKRQPSLDILDLVPTHLRTTLNAAIQRAGRSNSPVNYSDIKFESSDGVRTIRLTVTPIESPSSREKLYLISFDLSEPVDKSTAIEYTPASDELTDSRSQIIQLEGDLRFTKENLQATIEELETSNEELQATNEELIASNEELQSTNEELHSVNEELYTVNAEHQRKIGELAELNQDMSHLLENTDVATVFLDHDLRVRRFTSRIRNLFDLIDQDIGRPILTFSPKIPIDDLAGLLRQVQETGQAIEKEIAAPDRRYYLLRVLPYRSPLTASGIVLMLIDVSSLEALRGRLRWMSAIVESTDDAIIGQDLNGMITSWNAGAEKLYGYKSDEVVGQHVTILIPIDRRDEPSTFQQKIKTGQRLHSTDTVRLHKEGRPIHVSLTVSPVYDGENNLVGVSKIARDIGGRIAMENEIREQVRKREQFLATLSHELRNPLNAVLAASRVLQDDRSTDDGRQSAVAIIDRQVSMMRNLLSDLLDVTRISQGRIELHRKKIDICSLIDMIKETTQPEIDRHQSILRFEVPDKPIYVLGDQTRLVQIQVNLIHNAAKYSKPGREILVTIAEQQEWVVVSVIDQGVGIPQEFLPRIFEPFLQIPESKDNSDGGLGVGLTLVKALVEQHGGKIEVETFGRDKGSVFRVFLPVVTESKATHSGHVSETCDLISTDNHENKLLKIVLIEDIDDNRKMLQTLIELDGHTVLPAKSGESGLTAIVENQPDIAIVDIGLPGISGYEVASRVRQNAEIRQPFLIALTGYGQKSDVELGQAAGFDAHLVKPVDPNQLAKLLRERH